MESEVKVLISESYSALCDPVDCTLPGSSVQGIHQARILSGLPFPTPGDQTPVSRIAGRFFIFWTTKKLPI